MNTHVKRVHKMTHEAALFCAKHAVTIGGGDKFAALLSALQELNTEIKTNSVESVTGEANRGESVRDKQALVKELRQSISEFREFAPLVEGVAPEFAHQCILPKSRAYAALTSKARAVLDTVKPLETVLVEADLPADAVSRLEETLQQFEAAADTQSTSRSERIEANAEMKAKVSRARNLVRQLGAIVKLRLRGQPGLLEAWRSASRVESAPEYAEQEEESAEDPGEPSAFTPAETSPAVMV